MGCFYQVLNTVKSFLLLKQKEMSRTLLLVGLTLLTTLLGNSVSSPKVNHYLVKTEDDKNYLIAAEDKIVTPGRQKIFKNHTEELGEDEDEEEHFKDIDKFMHDMFSDGYGNDYSMDGPDVQTFIIKEEKPIMQGCRMTFI